MLMTVSKTTMWHTMITIFQQIGSFVVSTIVGPLATIALSLVYFDERVRKEAFDIQYMMQFLPQAPPVEASAVASAATAEPVAATVSAVPASSETPTQFQPEAPQSAHDEQSGTEQARTNS
jgi:hypothetical protein